MNKKLVWTIIVILILVAVAYFAYSFGVKKGSSVADVGEYLNQAKARVGLCFGTEVGAGNSCPGGTTTSGGITFCWGAGGLSISCYSPTSATQ